MNRFICVHGHFYQPPRENPWLETIEVQDSAYPYHDWNERVTAECYEPNAAARILDDSGDIAYIVNNYESISFNFGPTLLAWMQWADPETYQRILAADLASRERFSGHGSAMAQVYNHMIMPLANRRDKETQIRWGIADFECRFGRKPEGMWLAETAVDLETLDIMAELGLKFTVLAPRQAHQVRPVGSEDWEDVTGSKVDPTRAYVQNLPSGRSIALFFYDGPISQGIAFEKLLDDGQRFADRLRGALSDERTGPQLVHIATDGETYGHHHPHGDMALAYALEQIQNADDVDLTNYGEFLEKFPPEWEVDIFENSSWSCVHGVERWRSNCGCNSGGHDWNQEWRAPLRASLDWLRDTVAPLFRETASTLFKDPDAARNDYINVILDRSPENIRRFFADHRAGELSHKNMVAALELMELERHLMLMYTSCGWFFDELSGIETVQVIMYAGRAIQLAEKLFSRNLEGGLLNQLEQAKSNLAEYSDGRWIYEHWVRPAAVDLFKLGAHYAFSSLFEDYGDRAKLFAFTVHRQDLDLLSSGRVRVAVGRAKVVSDLTLEQQHLVFGVLHLGGHVINGGVRAYRSESAYQQMKAELVDAFDRGDVVHVMRLVDENFEMGVNSLKLLFADEQRRILAIVLEGTLAEANAAYRGVYEENAVLMRFLTDANLPMAESLRTAAKFALDANMREAIEAEPVDMNRIEDIVKDAKLVGADLDWAGHGYLLSGVVSKLANRLLQSPRDTDLLQQIEDVVHRAKSLPFALNLWNAQNAFYSLMHARESVGEAAGNHESREDLMQRLEGLGNELLVRVD